MWLKRLSLRRIWLSEPISNCDRPHRHERSYAAAARFVIRFRQAGVVKFDGGLLSSDGGVLALREVEERLRVADRLAACMIDPRAADQITHSLADVIRFQRW